MIRLVGVGKTYDDGTVAVHELDLDVEPGELVVLVGVAVVLEVDVVLLVVGTTVDVELVLLVVGKVVDVELVEVIVLGAVVVGRTGDSQLTPV